MSDEEESKESDRKQQRQEEKKAKFPYGSCLLARDTPQNRQLFPDGPFGNEAVADTVCPAPDQCPHYHYTEDVVPSEAANDAPIHLLIASFRDRLCARTLHNAFQHAENPKRLTFRVIQQTQTGSDIEDDEGCWDRYCAKYNPNCQEYKDQVRIIPVDSTESKGPTWARAKLSAMVHWDYVHRDQPDELDFQPVHLQDFCLQIDSHMDFSDNFDTGLIEMFHQTENDYAVLSTYVTDIEQNNKDPPAVPNLCMVTFTSSIRNWGTKECSDLVKPKLTNAMWGAGLSFHRCHAELNVPVDPYLDNVFDGEEGSRGIRLFTHGYDVYTPSRVLVTHDYHGHQNNPVVHTWGHHGNAVVQESNWKWMEDIDKARSSLSIFGSPRVNMILGIDKPTPENQDETELARASRFGVGTKRTLEQAVEFTGIDLGGRKMNVNKCGNNLWVPFEESPHYGVGETLSRGNAGETVPVFVVDPDDGLAGRAPARSSVGLRSGSASDAQATMTSSFTGFQIAGGLLLAAIAVIRVMTLPRRKDDMYKK